MKIFSVHISSLIRHIATSMLLLRVKIWPRKCHSNLTQLIIFILLSDPPFSPAFLVLTPKNCPSGSSSESKFFSFCFWTRMERTKIWKRISRMERIVSNVCYERYERYERKKRKTGNGNRRWRDSSLLRAAPKIQQLWAFFRRFDINIFNFREHFPPPNFAYSAHNFSLPSPNLN